MSKTNNTKQYAILWLNQQGHSPKEIAKELKISETQVSDIISENTTTKETNTQPNDVTQSVAPINSKNLMITHTAGKKTNTVAIMTKEASEVNDTKFKNNTRTISDKGIFRPKSQ